VMSRINSTSHHTSFVILPVFEIITPTSHFQSGIIDSNIIMISTIFLLALTIATTLLYYQRIKGIKLKYEEAKNVVGDVVVSFNKQLQRQEEQLDKASYKVEALSTRSENLVTKVEELERRANDLASKVAGASETQGRVTKDIQDVKAKLNDIGKVQEEIKQQISETPEAKIEAVIPIKRESALAPLTETELRVLEFIADGGGKTAPEIRDLTRLTREHSARLVKKLYEEGYLERDTGKTPYRYRVKDEMLKILKKSEAKA